MQPDAAPWRTYLATTVLAAFWSLRPVLAPRPTDLYRVCSLSPLTHQVGVSFDILRESRNVADCNCSQRVTGAQLIYLADCYRAHTFRELCASQSLQSRQG